MTRLAHDQYLAHLADESARFRSVLAQTDPAALVPSCPDWRANDLLGHLTAVQDNWADRLETRPAAPDDKPDKAGRPADHAALLADFDRAHQRLLAAFAGAAPEEEAWTWSPDPADHSVAFIARRQALEALIHRVDAEQAAGAASTLDPALATDGVDEVLDVMYGGCPPWGEFAPLPHYVRVDCTDTDASIWVQLGRFHGVDPATEVTHDEEDIHVVADPGTEPDAVISGTAAELLLRLWRRADGAGIQLAGDLEFVDRFRNAVHAPIN